VQRKKNGLWLLVSCMAIFLLGCNVQTDLSAPMRADSSLGPEKQVSKSKLPDGFVYLTKVDPTIQICVRYAGRDNFMGRPVVGYDKPVIILTQAAAEALKSVQEKVRADGYSLVIYDAYRPQKAVDDFILWSGAEQDQVMKRWFYPRVDKENLFDLGYIARKSGHSRGSTVDLTLIKCNKQIQPICFEERLAADGETVLPFLDDGTVDMGSSFDLFDEASHYKNNLINQQQKQRRSYLEEVMNECGFRSYSEEWWHFTLNNEPFPDTYFNFTIK
jgi:zinc D-Ala-D-Ala dipeptidase